MSIGVFGASQVTPASRQASHMRSTYKGVLDIFVDNGFHCLYVNRDPMNYVVNVVMLIFQEYL